MNDYLKAVAGLAAGRVFASVDNRIHSPRALRRQREKRERAFVARRTPTFPNTDGNYPGKRTPKLAGKPLAPRERFVRLVAAYTAFRAEAA